MQYYETVADIDSASDLIEELQADYPEEDGWSHDWSLDIRSDCVHVHFEAWQ